LKLHNWLIGIAVFKQRSIFKPLPFPSLSCPDVRFRFHFRLRVILQCNTTIRYYNVLYCRLRQWPPHNYQDLRIHLPVTWSSVFSCILVGYPTFDIVLLHASTCPKWYFRELDIFAIISYLELIRCLANCGVSISNRLQEIDPLILTS